MSIVSLSDLLRALFYKTLLTENFFFTLSLSFPRVNQLTDFVQLVTVTETFPIYTQRAFQLIQSHGRTYSVKSSESYCEANRRDFPLLLYPSLSDHVND